MAFGSGRIFKISLILLTVILFSSYYLRMLPDRLSQIPTTLALVHLTNATRPQKETCSISSMSTSWQAPNQTAINSLNSVLNGTGIYGYIFDSSTTPGSIAYDTYNWCNMPHVRSQEYKVPPADYRLAYVEVIHRHHKRTPYQSNTFPKEQSSWHCNDQALFYYGAPADALAAQISWSISQSPLNPFYQSGFANSTCQFPQITEEGLLDSRQHGKDLFNVYHHLLNFLPASWDDSKVQFRVTNNVITSQVASQVAIGMWPSLQGSRLPVVVQPAGIDSLEPQYTCSAAISLYSSYGVGSNNPSWQAHLNATQTQQLFAQLDEISGVNTSAGEWRNWVDHYFDNLSAKLCHDKSLPCSLNDTALCISREQADSVFRRGLYEYSFLYRDAPQSLEASIASYGVWVAELAHHLRAVINGDEQIIYRNNVAHDGSISRLLSILQIDIMVWPGMGSEVVFELWQRRSTGCWHLRVLWQGQVLKSSALGTLDLLPVETFLQYIDKLVGIKADKVPDQCKV